MSRSRAARCALETMEKVTVCNEHCWPVFKLVPTLRGFVNGELVLCLAESQEKTEPTRGRHLLPIGGVVEPSLLVKKNNVFVSHRGRVTKVAPECLRKASAAEQNELGHHDERKIMLKCTTEKPSRGKNPCSMILVIFLTLRCHAQQ